jgi:hypothetical protein
VNIDLTILVYHIEVIHSLYCVYSSLVLQLNLGDAIKNLNITLILAKFAHYMYYFLESTHKMLHFEFFYAKQT